LANPASYLTKVSKYLILLSNWFGQLFDDISENKKFTLILASVRQDVTGVTQVPNLRRQKVVLGNKPLTEWAKPRIK
jgi:hypothetical protein